MKCVFMFPSCNNFSCAPFGVGALLQDLGCPYAGSHLLSHVVIYGIALIALKQILMRFSVSLMRSV